MAMQGAQSNFRNQFEGRLIPGRLVEQDDIRLQRCDRVQRVANGQARAYQFQIVVSFERPFESRI